MGDKPWFLTHQEKFMATNTQVIESASFGHHPVRKVPELSLRSYTDGTQSERVRFIDNLYEGLIDYGFIVLNEHPLKMTQVEDSYKKVMEFFSLPKCIQDSLFICNIGTLEI